MGEMKRLVPANLVLGEPLPFSVFDERGNLLLRKGMMITMPDQIDRLVHRGALVDEVELRALAATPPHEHRPPPPPAPRQQAEPAFERVGTLILNLKHIVATALKTPEQIDIPARVGRMARTIQEVCAEDLDGALAAPCLDQQNAYIIVHQLMGAVLTEVIARRKGVAPEQRLSMVCAALTRDFGQLSLQVELDTLDGPLPPSLRQRLHEHPVHGIEQLQLAGVTDSIWLDAVRYHHERLDGSGYPSGAKAEAIPLEGRILAIADTYSALLKPRPYRHRALSPQNALREIHAHKDAGMDGELASILVQEIGMFPPATIVRLKCGEIAVVKSPTLKAEDAVVFSVYSKTGMVLAMPTPRATSAPGYEITGTVPLSECRSASIMMKRIWLKEAA
jgi:HD-GYP domain-containing protein (c-di-GMP phosphodiesterase class II)